MTMLCDAISVMQSGKSRFHLCRTTHKGSSSGQIVPPLALPAAHPHYEVVVCTDGSMRIVSHEKIYMLSVGDAVLIAPQAWHYETYDRARKSYRSFWLMVSPSCVETLGAGYRDGAFHVDGIQTLPQITEIQTLERIKQELIACENHWQMKARILLQSLLIDFDRRIHKESPSLSLVPYEPVQHLFHIIKTRFRDPLQIRSLAQEVGMSADHLSRHFHADYGVTFKQCLNITRIHHAQRLLQNGYAIKAAAEASGFEDVYYFTKVFKEYCGTTPGRFVKSLSESRTSQKK